MYRFLQRHFFICLLLCVCLSPTLPAQHYSFRSYGLEAGLPQSEVWDMIGDRRGYLWAATNGGGLARFNGREFQVFNKKHGLIDEQPRTLFEDSKGNIWISTFRGLSVYDGHSFKNYTEKEGVINSTFAQFIEDPQGRVWLYQFQNVQTRALLRFDKGKIENVMPLFEDVTQNGNFITGIFQDRQKRMYVQTLQQGLYVLENKKLVKAPLAKHSDLKDKQAITLFCHDSQDRLWFFATPFQGQPNQIELFYEKLGKLTKVAFPDCPSNTIASIREDSKKNIWFASFTRGAVCYKPDGTFQHFTQENSLLNNFLNVTAEDCEGNIWFLSRGKGIICFDKGRFIAINEEDGLKIPIVRSFMEDGKGLLWMGTAGGGIASFDGRKLTSYFDNDQTLGRVKCLDTTETGKLLMASDVGLLELQGDKYQKVNEKYGLPANAGGISYIKRATVAGEKLWFFGTFAQGIFVYNPQKNTSKNYNTNNSVIKHNYTHAIMQDSKGRVWISTNAGLVLYEAGGKLTNYDTSTGLGLQNALIIQACEDKWGRIWVATYGEGIAVFDEKKRTFTHTNPRNSALASSVIYSVMFDDEGNLWAGTQKGVDKISFDAQGNVTKIRNYNKYDGFSGLECNGAGNYKDRKGHLWFGTIKGAIRYNPDEDKLNTKEPLLNVTEVRLFFREVDWAGKEYVRYHNGLSDWFGLPKNLELPYSQNHVTIDFEAISFQSPEKVRYKWKLEGIDKDWTPETEKTEAVYPNLPAGTYTFRVKAMNNDGIWSKETSYTFSILPAWYQTWWATMLAVLLVAGIVGVGVRWRINALKAYQKHLEKQVAEKTAEVTEQNAMLLQQTEEITIQAENLQEANREITKRQQEMTDSITYAKRIQDAMLPQVAQIQELLPESFILFRPRDIVSGDFYWFAEVKPFRNQGFKLQASQDQQDLDLMAHLTKPQGKVVIAAADCTGHGVPGAFMSMIGNELLHEIVTEKGIHSPEQVLYFLHARVRQALKQDETTNRDGMDISICVIDRDRQVLEFAGARSRMLYFQGGEMHELKGDKSPVGGEQRELERVFTKQTLALGVGKAVLSGYEAIDSEQETLPTTLYMFSDGYIDQFGGKERKKFRIGQLRELLIQNQSLTLPAQQRLLEQTMDAWMREGGEIQIDDIMVIGIRI